MRGQKRFEEVLTEMGDELTERRLLTDSQGKALYSMDGATGKLSKFDGKKFSYIKGTSLKSAAASYVVKNVKGKFSKKKELTVSLKELHYPLYEGNTLYAFVDVENKAGSSLHYLASVKFTAKEPEWKLTKIRDFEGKDGINARAAAFAAMDGKLYIIAEAEGNDSGEKPHTSVYCYDIKSKKWSRGTDYTEASISYGYACAKDGKLWLMFGCEDADTLSPRVLSYDGSEWERHKDIPFVGRRSFAGHPRIEGACTPVGNGFVMMNISADGAGNVFLYNTTTGECEPMYYTFDDSIADDREFAYGVETRDGIWYAEKTRDSAEVTVNSLLKLPAESGAYESRYEPLPEKKANPAKISGKKVTVKRSSLRKKNVTLARKKIIKLSGAKGKVTYKLTSAKKGGKSYKKYFAVNTKTGKLTVKKGLKKGSYKLRVKVKAAGNSSYKSKAKTVTVTIRVK